ncbi:MAG: T9SS type A sorting domain-containing protein [Bacteroidales bacterium]|nr:T9SS type A sorting domain-containing protein [Bacteroidales bacterium]
MKSIYTLFFGLFFPYMILTAQDQEILWAQNYEISNVNEVGALTVDSADNIIIAGIHEGSVFVPYKGDLYMIKTDPNGNILWSSEMTGELIISDMTAVNDDIILAGQGYGTINYQDQQYGGASYFMFVFMLDANGDVVWHHIDESRNNIYCGNLSVGENGQFALHTRTESNQGDWIMIFDSNGNVVNERLLHPTETLIVDICYFNDNVYLTGEINGLSGIVIDTIWIPQSPFESTSFVLSLDNELTGKWVAIDTTLSNGDGTLEANEKGVFVYGETLQPPFNIVHNLKRFNLGGDLISEIVVPSFNENAILFPDMALAEDRVALFQRNSFNNDNFLVQIFDENLNLLTDKTITGISDQYSNYIETQDKNFIISHVHQSTLNLNDEITLPYEGSGKLPYLAKIGDPLISGFSKVSSGESAFSFYPNPAENQVTVSVSESRLLASSMQIQDASGNIVLERSINDPVTTIDISYLSTGVYFLAIFSEKGESFRQKLMIW